MATINPYLNFNNQCEEAFQFYQSVFGGELLGILRYKDFHSEAELAGDDGNKVMHVALPIGGGSMLMGSDTPNAIGDLVVGNNLSIAVSPTSEEEARHIYNGLAAGGQTGMPLDHAPWGALYGDLTDKYGVHWAVNYEKSQTE